MYRLYIHWSICYLLFHWFWLTWGNAFFIDSTVNWYSLIILDERKVVTFLNYGILNEIKDSDSGKWFNIFFLL